MQTVEPCTLEEMRAEMILSDPQREACRSHRRARAIMGENMFGFEETQDCFGSMSVRQAVALIEIPFSEQIMNVCAHTHLLVADLGPSIHAMQRWSWVLKVRGSFDQEPFMRLRQNPTWRLIRRDPLAGSFEKTWLEQTRLVPLGESILPARPIVYATLLYWHARQKKLLEGYGVRTSDRTQRGSTIVAGPFLDSRFKLGPWYGADRHQNLGLLTGREPSCEMDSMFHP